MATTPTGDILPTTGRASGEPLTMSSREIADMLESRHDTVKVSIERLVKRGTISIPSLAEYRDTNGRRAGEYLLDKRSSLIVVAQLSPEFTARVVDRWQELEAQVAKPGRYMQGSELAEKGAADGTFSEEGDAAKAGEHLIAVKGMLKHGEFKAWVEKNCAFSVRRAQHYMRIAKCEDPFAFDGGIDAFLEAHATPRAQAPIPTATTLDRDDAAHALKLHAMAERGATEAERDVARRKLEAYAKGVGDPQSGQPC